MGHIEREIEELVAAHPLLCNVRSTEESVKVSGTLAFDVTPDGLPRITQAFDIEIVVPAKYSAELPHVRELSGWISESYEHLYPNRSFCLAVPVEMRRMYRDAPSLLGFVNNLVVPFLYGYSYWEAHGVHPFGDRAHGALGIVQFYLDALSTNDERVALAAVAYLIEHGYRGHHPCPCGSGSIVRTCHREVLRSLAGDHTIDTLRNDFKGVLGVCLASMEADKYRLSKPLHHQVQRILEKKLVG